MSLFDHCATCKSCCHVDVGAPPLEVHLTSTERRFMQPICITRRCKNLGAAGCTLGNSKPFGCDLYPLAYDPASKQFFLDSECPLAKRYADQLSAPQTTSLSKRVPRVQRVQPRAWLLATQSCVWSERRIQVPAYFLSTRSGCADQLPAPDSDASRHLSRMAATIRRLERTDFEYLEANFAFDQDYFSLTPLNRTPD